MGVGINNQANSQTFLREGCGKPHNLFPTRLHKDPSVHFTTFFDYGCSSCYVSFSLAQKLLPYTSISPSTISGIGGQGPKVSKDALICVQFLLNSCSKDNWSTPISISAGVIPDNTFPGELTLGQTIFHILGLEFKNNGTLRLLNLPEKPILHPQQQKKFAKH